MNRSDVFRQLGNLLRPLGRRLRWRTSVEWFMQTAWVAFGICAIVLLAGRLFPIDGYRYVAGAIIGVWLIAWASVSLGRPITPFTVARRADAELGLRDRLSTAFVLAQNPSRRFDRELVSLQLENALAIARSIEPRRAFPIHIERALIARTIGAILIGIILLALPNPMDAVVAERARITQTAQEQAAKLEQLAQQLEQDKTLSPEDRNALLRQLRELIAQLKANPGEAKKALADLAQFQEQLRAKLDPASAAEQMALDALAQQLAQLAGAKDTPRDAAETAKLLEQLAAQLNQLSSEQRAALAGALERAASQTAASDPNLASALSAMAQAARSGTSTQQTQSTARQAAQALRDAANREALQQAIARALNQAEASQRAVAQAQGQGNQGSQGNQGNSGQGNSGQAQGQGNQGNQGNQGQGQNRGNAGQPGGGGGTNANTLPPGVRSGRANAPTGDNKAFGTGELETVYAPLTPGQGREEFVGGQQNQSGETTTRQDKSPQPGTNNPAIVPYTQVFQKYAEIAGQTMERSYIPSGLQDLVKEYFSGLEP
jgi:chemotaxis protein histidine kinase CheA